MTASDWWSRVWPSLLALFGIVAVVSALLFVVGRNTPSQPVDDGPGDIVATDTASPQPGGTEPSGPVTAPPEARAPVRVLNATSVSGLAKRTADQLRAGGWEVPSIGDFRSKEAVTTAYYPEGLEDSARALQTQFPEMIAEVSPRTGQMRPDQVTLVLGSDWATTLDGTESPNG